MLLNKCSLLILFMTKITITGDIGSGKSTVAKILAEKLGLKYVSTGSIMRKMAKERGISIVEFNKLAEKNPEYDKMIDEYQKKIGIKEDDFILEGRLGFYFIPNSYKIYLKASPEEAAHRIYLEKREDEKHNITEEETLNKLIERKESERKRYKELYGINLNDLSQFDCIINTNPIPADKVAQEIIRNLKKDKVI